MTPETVPLAEQVAAHILRRQAQAFGSRTFVICGNTVVTYGEAHARANRVANAFLALGASRGTRVGVLLRNRLEYLDLWFGLSRIGAIQLPINTEYKRAQILHVLEARAGAARRRAGGFAGRAVAGAR